MLMPVICAVAKTAAPTLGRIFAEHAVKALAVAAGTALVSEAVRAARNSHDAPNQHYGANPSYNRLGY